jgi:hypothetical protein
MKGSNMWLGIGEGIGTLLAIATHATALADNTERMFVQLAKPEPTRFE